MFAIAIRFRSPRAQGGLYHYLHLDNTLNRESRKPYVFYNSWCFQERNRFWNKRGYLMDMNTEAANTKNGCLPPSGR
ncbi:MAG: hypothetical protein IJ363_09980 [Clostridia bacterium]|nr:hypothetical protein [Clostridia bacterium]